MGRDVSSLFRFPLQTGMTAWRSDAVLDDDQLFTVTDLKQFAYCARVIFTNSVYLMFAPEHTRWTLVGTRMKRNSDVRRAARLLITMRARENANSMSVCPLCRSDSPVFWTRLCTVPMAPSFRSITSSPNRRAHITGSN